MAKKEGIINIKYNKTNKNSEIIKTKQERYSKSGDFGKINDTRLRLGVRVEKNVSKYVDRLLKVDKAFDKSIINNIHDPNKKDWNIRSRIDFIKKKLNKRVKKLYKKLYLKHLKKRIFFKKKKHKINIIAKTYFFGRVFWPLFKIDKSKIDKSIYIRKNKNRI